MANPEYLKHPREYGDFELQQTALGFNRKANNDYYQRLIGEIYLRQRQGRYNPGKSIQEIFEEPNIHKSKAIINESHDKSIDFRDEHNGFKNIPAKFTFFSVARLNFDGKIDEFFDSWAKSGGTNILGSTAITQRRILSFPHTAIFAIVMTWNLYSIISASILENPAMNIAGLAKVISLALLFTGIQLVVAAIFYYQSYATLSYNVAFWRSIKRVRPNNGKRTYIFDFDSIFAIFWLVLMVALVHVLSVVITVDFAIQTN